MRIRRRLGMAVAIGAALLSPAGCRGVQRGSEPPEWKPDAALIPRLADPVDVDGFRIRPPKGYASRQQPGPGGSRAIAWVGPARADGTRPTLMVVLMKVPPGEKLPTLDEAFETFLAGTERRRRNWSRTAAEYGSVNGMPFVRARWSGTMPQTGRGARGFIYAAVAHGAVLQVSSQDAEPHHESGLAVAEAAALTFDNR